VSHNRRPLRFTTELTMLLKSSSRFGEEDPEKKRGKWEGKTKKRESGRRTRVEKRGMGKLALNAKAQV